MDEFFEIIAFVVTFIIFIVSAIIKQKNKSGNQPQKSNDIIESFFGIEEDPHDAYNKGEILEESLKRKQEMADEKLTQLQTEEGVDAIPDDEDVYYQEQLPVARIMDDFDLKKAVIYSEILNRKTF